jgi:hypothetical protein
MNRKNAFPPGGLISARRREEGEQPPEQYCPFDSENPPAGPSDRSYWLAMGLQHLRMMASITVRGMQS